MEQERRDDLLFFAGDFDKNVGKYF